MAWIKVEQTLPTHRKTLALAPLLGKKRLPGGAQQAVGLMVTFWLWALDNYPDGCLKGVLPVVIASAVGWDEKDADALMDALVGAGFLDEDWTIHDWGEYAGALVARRRKDKERKKDERAADVHRTSDGQDADSPMDVREKSGARVRVEKSRVDVNANASTKTRIVAPGFDEFWALYPRKTAKQKAHQAWSKLKPDDKLFQTILGAIRDQAKSAQWLRDDGQFIPHAATWLNGRRWEDTTESLADEPKISEDEEDYTY